MEKIDKIMAYLALHQRLGSTRDGDFNAIAEKLGAEPELGYPLAEAKGPAGEAIGIYQIPEEEKGRVLKEMYIFATPPNMDDELLDIHEDKTFRAGDFLVIRDHGLNFLVSPYFQKSGGSVLDWTSPKSKGKDGIVIEMKAFEL